MAEDTMNEEWCSLRTPITRLGYGNHESRGFVETGALKVGGQKVRRSKFTGATYGIKLLEIEPGPDEKPTASIEIIRTGSDGEMETRTVELAGWTWPETYAEVVKDHDGALDAYDALLAGRASGPHRVVALPFKGNDKYVVAVYATDISIPGTACKLLGQTKSAKLRVSEGRLDAPLNYAAVEQ